MSHVSGILFWSSMSYKNAIVAAIEDLKDHHLHGSSMVAIKKHVEASLPGDKKWRNSIFLRCLKTAVDKGELVQVKDRYKLSADFKRKRAEGIKARIAEKEKHQATHKKATPVKEVPKRKPEVAKKKLLDSKVVTIVKEGRKTEKMELEKEAEPPKPDHKESPKKKITPSKTKIIPRKVLKKAVKDPMETI